MVLARYSQPKLLAAAAVSAVLAIACAWISFGNGDVGIRMSSTLSGVFLPILFITMAAIAAKAFSMAFGSLIALEHSPEGLVVHANWSRSVVPWPEYAGVSVEGWVYRVSLIPVGKVNYLLICQNSGGIVGNKKIRLVLGLMDLAPGEVRALGERIDEMARSGGAMPMQAVGVSRPVIADSGPKPVDAGFDADAAIARYLASRAAQPVETPVAATAMPMPVAPARPAFGRKGVST